MRANRAGLWEGIPLPPWTDQSPIRLYILFKRHQAQDDQPMPAVWQDEYARLLMHVVSARFTKAGWMQSLPRLRLDPYDIAVNTLQHVRRKTLGMKLRLDCWRAMMKSLNTTIYFYVLGVVKDKRRQPARETCVTDHSADPDAAEMLEPGTGAPPDAPSEHTLSLALAGAEDECIGDIVTRSPRQSDAIVSLFDRFCRSLTRDNELPPLILLPRKIQREVSFELHSLIATRFTRLVRRCAAA